MSEAAPGKKLYCAKRIFSGARWDMGGHPCSRAGVVERDGKWWCRQHDPEAEKARRQKAEEKYQAEQNRVEELYRSSLRVIKRLGGLGIPRLSAFDHRYDGGVTLSAAEAAILAKELEDLRIKVDHLTRH